MADQSGITYDGSELGKVLENLEVALPGARQEALKQIAIIMTGLVEDEYLTEGHGQWAPFAESTLASRRASSSPKLLQDTGVAVGSTSAEVEEDAAIAFTNVPYMVYHTSDQPRHVIPYRNPFNIPEADLLQQAEDTVLAAITAFL